MRSVTGKAVEEARISEIKREMLKSTKLKVNQMLITIANCF